MSRLTTGAVHKDGVGCKCERKGMWHCLTALLWENIEKRDVTENNNQNSGINDPMLNEMGEEGEKETDTYKLCPKMDTFNAN